MNMKTMKRYRTYKETQYILKKVLEAAVEQKKTREQVAKELGITADDVTNYASKLRAGGIAIPRFKVADYTKQTKNAVIDFIRDFKKEHPVQLSLFDNEVRSVPIRRVTN